MILWDTAPASAAGVWAGLPFEARAAFKEQGRENKITERTQAQILKSSRSLRSSLSAPPCGEKASRAFFSA